MNIAAVREHSDSVPSVARDSMRSKRPPVFRRRNVAYLTRLAHRVTIREVVDAERAGEIFGGSFIADHSPWVRFETHQGQTLRASSLLKRTRRARGVLMRNPLTSSASRLKRISPTPGAW